MRSIYKLAQQLTVLILVMFLFLHSSVSCSVPNKEAKVKNKEREKRQLVEAKIEEYKNLLGRANQGDAEAQFLIAKRAFESFKEQEKSEDYLVKMLIWLYKSAFKGYKPAVDLLLEEFGIRTNAGQFSNIGLSCIAASHKHKDIGYVNKIVASSCIPIPFSALYKAELSNAKFRVFKDEFKNYCADLFSYINSYETYQMRTGFIADLINYTRQLTRVIDYDNKSPKENLINLNKYIQDNKYLIDIYSILFEYIKIVLKDDYFRNFSQTHKLELINRCRELLGSIGIAQLNIVSHATDKNVIQEYVKGYWETKGELRTNYGVPKELFEIDYLEDLNKLCELQLQSLPHLINYFNPQSNKQASSNRIKSTKQHSKYTEKRLNDYLHDLSRDAEHGWIFLQGKMDELNTQFVEVCSKSILSEKDLGQAIKKANKKFFEIERLFFSMKLSKSPSVDYFEKHLVIDPSYNMGKPTVNDLIQLHKFISKLSVKQNTDINGNLYLLMTKGVGLLILANNFDQALIRLKAMEAFYSTRDYPKNFDYFLALTYAQCGQYEKLSQVYKLFIQQELESQRNHQERNQQNHQKRIAVIKESQQLALSSLELSSLVPIEPINTGKKEQRLNTVIPGIEDISEVAYLEKQKMRAEHKEARANRHQEAVKRQQEAESEYQEKQLFQASVTEEVQSDIDKEAEVVVQSQDLPISETSPVINFPFTKRSFKTVTQIFHNDWKISRSDIENLFNELGQTIHISTGSSHHIINIPSGIALVNQDGQIINMITNLSAHLGGHLSLPSWQDMVPIYMRSQIKNLLSSIGIYKENYFKGNRDSHLQFVARQNSQEESQNISPDKPAANKKSRRRNRGKKSAS